MHVLLSFDVWPTYVSHYGWHGLNVIQYFYWSGINEGEGVTRYVLYKDYSNRYRVRHQAVFEGVSCKALGQYQPSEDLCMRTKRRREGEKRP